MDVSTYLKTHKLRDRQLAKLAGCDRSYITRIKLGRLVVSPKIARAIHDATGGELSTSDLRPDLWPREDREPEEKILSECE